MRKLFAIALAVALATSVFAMGASAEETKTYKTTDKITVEYTDVEKGWIAIYAGATPGEYGATDYQSLQYAYVTGSGSVEFNVPDADNAISSASDKTYDDTTKVFYNIAPSEPLVGLAEGDYHIVLFKGTGYEVDKQLGVFKVSDAATEPEPVDPPKTGDAGAAASAAAVVALAGAVLFVTREKLAK